MVHKPVRSKFPFRGEERKKGLLDRGAEAIGQLTVGAGNFKLGFLLNCLLFMVI